MHVEWFGQSAFRLQTPQATVFVDPFGDMSATAARGLRWEYPAIEDVAADLLLVTHAHRDHNGVEAIGGDPVTLRATAGRLDSPIGDVVAIASEHDDVAGTQRGANTIFAFTLGDLRVVHFGDFGQTDLRDEQAEAIGHVDLAFLPVGGSATVDGARAARIAERLAPQWVVPMHYRTHRIDFLDPADAFVDRIGAVHRVGSTSFSTDGLPVRLSDGPLAIVPDAP